MIDVAPQTGWILHFLEEFKFLVPWAYPKMNLYLQVIWCAIGEFSIGSNPIVIWGYSQDDGHNHSWYAPANNAEFKDVLSDVSIKHLDQC